MAETLRPHSTETTSSSMEPKSFFPSTAESLDVSETALKGVPTVVPSSVIATTPVLPSVKHRFFTAIGIEASSEASKTTISSTEASTSGFSAADPMWTHQRNLKVATSHESLKYDKEEDRKYAPKNNNSNSDSNGDCGSGCQKAKRRKKKRLSFDERVEVVPIPMRTEYSSRIRSRIWSNARDIHTNAIRNTIEFATENWNWRHCLEDEDMFVNLTTSELIHPCHYESMQHGFRLH